MDTFYGYLKDTQHHLYEALQIIGVVRKDLSVLRKGDYEQVIT